MRVFILGCLIVFTSSFAIASVQYLPKSGMPVCVDSANNALGSIRFSWKGDVFEKQVFWRKSSRLCGRSELFAAKKQPVLYRSEDQLGSIAIPRVVKRALVQLQEGATVYREIESAKEFIRAQGIKSYDLKLNRKFTAKYGIRFSSQVYREFLRAIPATESLLESLENHYQDWLTQGRPQQLSAGRAKNVTFVFVPGVGSSSDVPAPNGPREQSDMLKIYDEMRALLPAGQLQLLHTKAFGTISQNVALLKEQLAKLFKTREAIALIAVCKGSVESLIALSEILDDQSKKKLVGFASLSGAQNGSFMVDFVEKRGLLPVFNVVTRVFPKQKVMTHEAFRAYRSIAPSLVSEYRSAYLETIRDVPTLELIGISPEHGLIQEKPVDLLQKIMVRKAMPALRYRFGANDGYIEYPMELPNQNSESAILPIDAPHHLITGTIDLKSIRLNLKNPSDRTGFLWAFLSEFITRLVQ